MSDDDEMEDFSINNEDYMRAINPNYKRTRMTKEESILGIWATGDYSDDDDEDDPNDKYRGKNKSSTINFVSGQTRREEPEKKTQEEQEDVNTIQLFFKFYEISKKIFKFWILRINF